MSRIFTGARDLFSATSVNLLGVVLSYLYFAYLANLLAPSDFGVYLLCVAWAALGTVFVELASNQVFAHFAKSVASRSTAISVFFVLKIASFSGLTLCLLAAEYAGFLQHSVLILLLLCSSLHLAPLYEVARKNTRFALICLFEKMALFIAILSLGDGVQEVAELVYLYCCFSVLAILFQVFDFKREARAFGWPKVEILKRYLGAYWGFIFTTFFQAGYGHLSRLMVEAKKGPENLAFFAIALQFIAVAAVFQTQVDRFFRPLFIEESLEGKPKLSKALLFKYCYLGLLPMAVLTLLLLVFSEPIIRSIFGSEYSLAADVLQVMSSLCITICFIRLFDMIFTSISRIDYVLMTNFFGFVVLLALFFILDYENELSTFAAMIGLAQCLHILFALCLLVKGQRIGLDEKVTK